jgi:hypothetical protein
MDAQANVSRVKEEIAVWRQKLADLEGSLKQAKAGRDALEVERQSVVLAAETGDAKAQKTMEQIDERWLRSFRRLENIELALAQARRQEESLVDSLAEAERAAIEEEISIDVQHMRERLKKQPNPLGGYEEFSEEWIAFCKRTADRRSRLGRNGADHLLVDLVLKYWQGRMFKFFPGVVQKPADAFVNKDFLQLFEAFLPRLARTETGREPQSQSEKEIVSQEEREGL